MIKIVKVTKSQGYGDGLFEVVRVDHSAYVLKPLAGGSQFVLYIAHTYEDFDTKKKSLELTKARSASIGRNKRR